MHQLSFALFYAIYYTSVINFIVFGKCSLECRQHFNFWGSDVVRIPWCAGITGWHQLAQSSSSQTALLLQEIACGMSTNLAPYDTSVPRDPLMQVRV